MARVPSPDSGEMLELVHDHVDYRNLYAPLKEVLKGELKVETLFEACQKETGV